MKITKRAGAVLFWKKYRNFFDLYQKHKSIPQLIYVIGKKKLCYIGCVGARGGKNGLAQRYQKQYLERAKSIFGMEAPNGQPAYVGIFKIPKKPHGKLILKIERAIQAQFKKKNPNEKPAFTFGKGKVPIVLLANTGTVPPFLSKSTCITTRSTGRAKAARR